MSVRTESIVRGLRRKLLAMSLAAVALVPNTTLAATDFSSLLDLELSIPGGAIENKFGFATSFPRPGAAPAFGSLNGNPGGAETLIQLGGGTATLLPANGNEGIERKTVPGGRGMKLNASGTTNAILDDDSIGQAERWITGHTRFRLGNFTGRPGLPAAEELTIGLNLDVKGNVHANATNDIAIVDRANAKAIYSLTNSTAGGAIVPQTELIVNDDDAGPRQEIDVTANVPIAPIKIPAASFVELDLMGHIYVAGESRGSEPPHAVPPFRPAGSIQDLPDRMDVPFPVPEMELELAQLQLFGDVNPFGDVLLAGMAGVPAPDPLALHGVNTVFTDQVMHTVDSFFDIAYEIEVPVNDFAPVALQETLIAPGGTHTMMMDMQLGTGVGDQFQLSQQPEILGVEGQQSPVPPQELTGAYQLLDINDPFLATQMLFGGQMQPGQMSQFEYIVNTHDLVDGVIDGMARFTVRKFVEGFSGDYNGDLFTDGGDLQLWQQLYGTQDFAADGNANGLTDGGDYLKWQQNLGRGGDFAFDNPGAAAISAVPEPASIALMIMGVTACGLVRRRG
ncbi:MAG: PEP-CTERM sorting domain-containing protein [Planctomycetota bacterium]